MRVLALIAALGGLCVPGQAQSPSQPSPSAAPVPIPGFWDPKRRPERPDTSRITLIRFMSENDYPPFNFAGPDGNPAGFNVDLARMLCEELKIACTVQMRRFDTLAESLLENRGDAVISSIAINPDNRKRLAFTEPYYRTPARFASRRDQAITDVRPEQIEARKVAVVEGSAHEAYLKALFPEVDLKPFPSGEAARDALRKGEVELLFGDGLSLASWLNGTDSAGCCVFRGGPFTESRYFGEGVGIAVRPGNETLRAALNWALFRVWERGRYNDLMLRYFPISPF